MSSLGGGNPSFCSRAFDASNFCRARVDLDLLISVLDRDRRWLLKSLENYAVALGQPNQRCALFLGGICVEFKP